MSLISYVEFGVLEGPFWVCGGRVIFLQPKVVEKFVLIINDVIFKKWYDQRMLYFVHGRIFLKERFFTYIRKKSKFSISVVIEFLTYLLSSNFVVVW